MIKRSKCENKGIVPTEMELVLEYTQQGASHEVSDHLKMEMEMEIPSSSNVKLITECSDTTYTCYEVMKDLIKVSKLPQTLISYSSSQDHLKMEMEMEIPSSSNVKLITECSDTTYTCYEVMQGRERDSKNAAWLGLTNGKEGRCRYLVHSGADKTYYDLRDMYGGHELQKALRNRLKCATTYHPLNETEQSEAYASDFEGIVKVIIRVFDVLHLKRCMEGNVGRLFCRLKLEKVVWLGPSWYKRQPIRVEVGDKVMLEVSSWKDVVHFGKKNLLAPRYKYLADTNLHVHLEEIKVDKTLRFVKEPVEIIDHNVKSLKRSSILIINSIGTRSEVMRIS
ncbi:hypothetical protein Tco_0474722 [Tanacetum coccineum]